MDRRLLLTRVDELHTIGEATLRARVLLDGLVGIFASAYIVHDLAELHDFVTDDAVFFVQCEALDIALSEFEVTRAFLQRAIQRADLAAEAFAEVIETSAASSENAVWLRP